MSDAVDYFKAYAERVICKARNMRPGRPKVLQRAVGRVYHWLSKEAAFGPNTHRMDDFRVAREVEKTIGVGDTSTRPAET
ncbi:hypothetical protein [Tardiphaga sp. 768_D3_N2_1]|uniref:hypothetical protein n=1 Tax=Tardiphaga sp. 768_D3_N2_1 TaxID=3240783 RepID=UPI003F8A6747